jgi:hypothetical protein
MEECTSYRRLHEPNGVRKDNDFFSRLPLLDQDHDRLLLQVSTDLNFLAEKLQVMDYSWLGDPLFSSPDPPHPPPSPPCSWDLEGRPSNLF